MINITSEGFRQMQFCVCVQGVTLLMMGTADDLPQVPAEKPVFMEDMTEQQLATAVSTEISTKV